jgi:hypothetical protein
MRSDCVHRVPSGSLASEDPSGSGQLHVHDAATGTFLRVIPRCDDQEARPLFERDLLARQARAQQDASESKPRIVLAEEDAVAVPATAGSSSSPGRHLLQFPSDYDGWEAYTEWYNADGIDVFLGSVGQPRRTHCIPARCVPFSRPPLPSRAAVGRPQDATATRSSHPPSAKQCRGHPDCARVSAVCDLGIICVPATSLFRMSRRTSPTSSTFSPDFRMSTGFQRYASSAQ